MHSVDIFNCYVENMMKLLVLILGFILVACTGHYEGDEFDLAKLKESRVTLFEAIPVDGKISAQWWPAAILNIKPKEIRSEENGIYIVLDSFWAEESGLFIPSVNKKFKPGVNDNSIYVLLDYDIYSYHIKK